MMQRGSDERDSSDGNIHFFLFVDGEETELPAGLGEKRHCPRDLDS
jgi:hypothetical protein